MTNSNSSGGGGGGGGGHGTIKMSAMTTPFMPVGDILAHKLTMFNYKLPSARTLHESSLIYCNLCDFSCDLTDKSAIICHYLSKHPDDNIVYSYLWPQMETGKNEKWEGINQLNYFIKRSINYIILIIDIYNRFLTK